ncbi:hypothetical protein BK128_21410 [Viridibacillus sp. FSL H7-0596]|uniref:helix-turn-helix domain-containing protein n=1 Tax=Viridibacillus sp. FSL H7-0596 TaxID=1928923 RepID=UPI00096D2DCB|nr:helix-turn-helix transcriptional regulator [Viridibacillus sp. FSL H7-0596]OMC81831.1 hypothetical protein BK128_21410 [Viridibacillus sp. FSL H7-0596]
MMSFGAKLKELRKKYNKEQSELAKHLNVTQPTISYWENDKKLPDFPTISKIADFYNVSTEDLRDIEDSYLYNDNERKFLEMIEKTSVEMTDAQIMEKFNFSIDGKEASADEIKGAVAYIRAIRSSMS